MTKDESLKQANDIAVGVDVTKEGTHVVAMRLKPNGVNEVIYSQFHPMAQQEAKDEPVAWISPTELLVMRGNALGGAKDWRVNVGLKPEDGDVGLYTTPLQRTWVGLTEAECGVLWKVEMTPFDYYRAIEAKLKEKNT